MIDVMHYTVVKRENHPDTNRIIYLLESDGGRWCAVAAAPEDIDIQVGTQLKHFVAYRFKVDEKTEITISPSATCSDRETAEARFKELLD
jgi:hypothetical protein